MEKTINLFLIYNNKKYVLEKKLKIKSIQL